MTQKLVFIAACLGVIFGARCGDHEDLLTLFRFKIQSQAVKSEAVSSYTDTEKLVERTAPFVSQRKKAKVLQKKIAKDRKDQLVRERQEAEQELMGAMCDEAAIIYSERAKSRYAHFEFISFGSRH